MLQTRQPAPVAHDTDHAEPSAPAAAECCATPLSRDPFYTGRKYSEPPNSAIQLAVSAGRDIRDPRNMETRDISYIMSCVRDGRFEHEDLRATIHTIRELPNPKLAAGMKLTLPYFLGSVCAPPRCNANVQYANFMIFDLDHVPDVEGLKREAVQKLPFVKYAFRSVRDGVKLIAAFKPRITDEKAFRAIWQSLALQISKALDFPVDTTPDWARACFLSWDPDLIANLACRSLDPKLALAAAEMVLELSGKVERGKGGKDGEQVNGEVVSGKAEPADGTQGSDQAQLRSTISPLHRSTGPAALESSRQTQGQTGSQATGRHGLQASETADDFEHARRVVNQLAQLRLSYTDWVRCGYALYAAFGDRGRELWEIFRSNPNYEDSDSDLRRHWKSFGSVHSITLATLFYIGGKYGCE
jgi:hypothetical protein